MPYLFSIYSKARYYVSPPLPHYEGKKIRHTKTPTKKPFVVVVNKLAFSLRTTDWFRRTDWF